MCAYVAMRVFSRVHTYALEGISLGRVMPIKSMV